MLYTPYYDKETGEPKRKVNEEALKSMGIEDEPINWGCLGIMSITEEGDKYIITIDEAREGCCPTLCHYLEIS